MYFDISSIKLCIVTVIAEIQDTDRQLRTGTQRSFPVTILLEIQSTEEAVPNIYVVCNAIPWRCSINRRNLCSCARTHTHTHAPVQINTASPQRGSFLRLCNYNSSSRYSKGNAQVTTRILFLLRHTRARLLKQLTDSTN